MKTTLLLDADIIAYKTAALNQKDIDWGDTGKSRTLNHEQARKHADELIAKYAADLGTQNVIVCLSDPDRNFRKELNPSYKEARVEIEKPELLMWVKEYLHSEYRSYMRPRLEADDVMGILATHPSLIEGKKIIVSEDKDMRTIPTNVYNPDKPGLGVLDISELDADRFLLWQALVGDPTDGYKGAKGIGMGGKYVDNEFIEGPRSLTYAHDVLTADRKDLWDLVLEAYGSVGLTEDDAIMQVRMAHILRASSYNFSTKKVKLWQPYWLSD